MPNGEDTEIRIDDVIVVERKPFVPEAPIADVDTPLLKGNDIAKRDFLLAVNATRMGTHRVTVAVEYEIQVGEPQDLRAPDKDFVAVPRVPGTLHIGVMTTATHNRERQFYFRVADVLRSTGLKTGWTSMRATGIRGFRILQMSPGPIFDTI